MAVKSTDTKSAAAAAEKPAKVEQADTGRPRVESTCVVDVDFHVGNATPGSKVCSYHAMHYAADGSRR